MLDRPSSVGSKLSEWWNSVTITTKAMVFLLAVFCGMVLLISPRTQSIGSFLLLGAFGAALGYISSGKS